MDEYLDNYLAHHGIKGQKWGVRRTPEQLGHATKSKKTNKTVKNALDYAKKKVAEKKASRDLNNRENLKNYLRNHPEKLPRYGRKLTREEADEIVANIQYDRKLKDIRNEEYNRKLSRLRNFTNTAVTINNAFQAGKNLYNAYVDLQNSMGDGKKLTKIGEQKKEDRSAIEKIVNSGTASEVLNNISKMTSNELENAMKRLNYEKKLKDMT